MQTPEFLNGYQLQTGKHERTGGDQLFKLRYCHSIQAPSHFAESGCAI